MNLNFGLIGMSEENGHPYSWAAICNGYSPEHMNKCEFPVIPRYLAEQRWPKARIPGVEVTHIWTQDRALSDRVARASLIPSIVDDPLEMIEHIDALLLARDDAENHLKFAKPFLEAGIPVFIDKPIALSLSDLTLLYKSQQYDGQIFSCSALRYAKELELSEEDREVIGSLRVIIATAPKSWRKYSVHIIEPVLRLPECAGTYKIVSFTSLANSGGTLVCKIKSGPDLIFIATGTKDLKPISIRYCGEKGSVEKLFSDSFSAFHAALCAFITNVSDHQVHSGKRELARIVKIIEAGCHD